MLCISTPDQETKLRAVGGEQRVGGRGISRCRPGGSLQHAEIRDGWVWFSREPRCGESIRRDFRVGRRWRAMCITLRA